MTPQSRLPNQTLTDRKRVWSIILAAGDGTRLATLTREIHGDDRPKQFAILGGERSLLQETLARMQPIAPPDRTVVVVGDRHAHYAEQQLQHHRGLDVVRQPHNLGTGPGILLPLARVVARDPDATVVITPSDHHFSRPGRFTSRLWYAMEAAHAAPSGVCIVGVEAEDACSDFGWIVPGAELGGRPGAHLVDTFVEKPAPRVAAWLLARGGLWNTFVMVGHARRVWELARTRLRDQVRLFEDYARAVGTRGEAARLGDLYRTIGHADFSRDVLAHASGLGVVAVGGSGWSDWGTPERVAASVGNTEARGLALRAATPSPAAA